MVMSDRIAVMNNGFLQQFDEPMKIYRAPMKVFVAALDEGSLAGASRKTGRSAAAVSRAIAYREAHVGVPLLHRTTRSIKLSEAGERYAVACRKVLMDLEEADRSAAGERLIRKMRAEFSAVTRRAKDRLRGKSPVRVYCEAWPNPRISSPPWVAELVRSAGGEMVVPPGEKVSDERVAHGQPDVIVLAWAATGTRAKASETYKVAAWKDVPAIRERRVVVIADELLNTPGPPLVAGIQELARVIYSR